MKQFWIVRHAKSDWGNPGVPDFERPLNKRGLRNAPDMGQWLGEQGVDPQLVLCSPALRARHTAELIAAGLNYPVGRIRYEPRVYEAGPETLLQVIEEVDADIERLMLVGHNPGLTQLVNMLGAGPLDNLPTCAVASLSFESDDWALLCRKPVSESIWRPKEVLD